MDSPTYDTGATVHVPRDQGNVQAPFAGTSGYGTPSHNPQLGMLEYQRGRQDMEKYGNLGSGSGYFLRCGSAGAAGGFPELLGDGPTGR